MVAAGPSSLDEVTPPHVSGYRASMGAGVLTERPIQEIAQDCGYSDPSLFYKAFTQYNGQNPSQYRKEHRFRS